MMSLMGDREREFEMFLCDHLGFLNSGFLYHIMKNRSRLLVDISLRAEIWIVGCFLPDYSSRLLITQLWVWFLCTL